MESIYKNEIRNYMIYRFFTGFLFFMPVLLSIYFTRDISIEQIFLIECFFYLSIFLLEIPSGWLADKYGHDKSVFIGLAGTFLAYVIFSMTFSLIGIIICQVLLGFFAALVSGSDRASFYKHVIKEDSEAGFLLQKKAHILFIVANLLSFIIGGALFHFDNNGFWILLLTGVANFIAGVFYFLYRKGIKRQIGNSYSDREKTTSFSNTVKNIKVVLIPCLIGGSILGLLANFYWISQMFYESLYIDEFWRGILFTVSSLITILFSKLRIFKSNGASATLIILFPACYFITLIDSLLAIPLFILIYSILKIETQPFIENYILSLAKYNKALSLSITSWIFNFVNVFLMLMFYILFNYFTFKQVMVIQGVLLLITLIIVYLVYKSKNKPMDKDQSNPLPLSK